MTETGNSRALVLPLRWVRAYAVTTVTSHDKLAASNGARLWLLLSYKIPRQPTSARVYVWRKLRRLGALSVQDAVWVLPLNPQTRELFQWLAADIAERGGQAAVWESRAVSDGQDDLLIARFREAVQQPYRKILAALRRRRPDIAALSRRYRQVLAQDYFPGELRKQVRDAIVAARKETS